MNAQDGPTEVGRAPFVTGYAGDWSRTVTLVFFSDGTVTWEAPPNGDSWPLPVEKLFPASDDLR